MLFLTFSISTYVISAVNLYLDYSTQGAPLSLVLFEPMQNCENLWVVLSMIESLQLVVRPTYIWSFVVNSTILFIHYLYMHKNHRRCI